MGYSPKVLSEDALSSRVVKASSPLNQYIPKETSAPFPHDLPNGHEAVRLVTEESSRQLLNKWTLRGLNMAPNSLQGSNFSTSLRV